MNFYQRNGAFLYGSIASAFLLLSWLIVWNAPLFFGTQMLWMWSSFSFAVLFAGASAQAWDVRRKRVHA